MINNYLFGRNYLMNGRLFFINQSSFDLIFYFSRHLNFFFRLFFGYLLFSFLNKSILSVRISWFLRFWIWIFIFKYRLTCLRSNLYNILCLPLFSDINCFSIWFLNRFYRRFVLNKNSKWLSWIAREILRRIKSLGWFRNFRSYELTISYWWRTMKVLDLWRRRDLAFKVSSIRTIKNFLFDTWIYNYSWSTFLSLLVHFSTRS